MTTFVAAHTGFETSVRESFSRMALMATIGARLVRVAAGQVHIDMAAVGSRAIGTSCDRFPQDSLHRPQVSDLVAHIG